MILISIINTSALKRIIIPLFIVSFIFLALVPLMGVEVKGAKRWLDFYFFRLQPIEILKPFFHFSNRKYPNHRKVSKLSNKIFFQFFTSFLSDNSFD